MNSIFKPVSERVMLSLKTPVFLLVTMLCLPFVIAEENAEVQKTEEQIRDQQLAEQIRQGEAKWLNDGNTDYLAVFCASLIETKGSMLWLTAPNQTILSPGVMSSICDYYPTVGWQVMSVAATGLEFSRPPLVANTTSGSADENTKPSLTIANETEWFEAQKKANLSAIVKRLLPAEREILATNSNYVLVAIASSAAIALEAINSNQIKPRAIIMLNVTHPNDPRQIRINAQLKSINIPVLDIYHVSSKPQALERYRKNKDDRYRQLLVPAMQNDFRGAEQLVLSRIENWLKKL